MEDKKKTLDFRLRIHTVPSDLLDRVGDEDYKTYVDSYKIAVKSQLLWKVGLIDPYNQMWIYLDYEDEQGEYQCCSLRVDEGTYKKVEFGEEYDAIWQSE